ncbi:MAG: DUF401 family protein [Deltaproteobacteria bacterium]|nr:DUF401 family protein [Deltaproteobacteria bacterium]MBW2085396.1 DUF401 family protein [Deltaproteobacteria bacterium]
MLIFSDLPALVKVSLAFGLILATHRLKIHLSLGLFLGGVVLGLLMDLWPSVILTTVLKSLANSMVFSLLMIVALILVLSRLMSDSGQLDRMVTSFTKVTHNARIVTAVMPAMIGLLPMPGGALFSAPMVQAVSQESELDANLKTAINYWFRHIWEYWWPLYPGVILAVGLLEVQTWRFIMFQSPLTLFAIGAGFIFLLRRIPKVNPSGRKRNDNSNAWRVFLKEVSPILLVVLAVPGVALIELSTGLHLPPLTSVFLGLVLGLAWVIGQNRIPAGQVLRAVMNRSIPPMLFLILGIMAFKGVLVESRAVDQIHAEMIQYGIPPLLVVLLMPFLSGFITGISIGFVGASFPLIVPLLAHYQGMDYMAHAFLAYAFGFMGMMLSPVHLCFLVTRDYFNANMLKCYNLLAGPAAVFLLCTLLFFGFFQMIN